MTSGEGGVCSEQEGGAEPVTFPRGRAQLARKKKKDKSRVAGEGLWVLSAQSGGFVFPPFRGEREKGMPKRSYPFADVAPVQLKTRVRLKELSQGVMGEQYRDEIFEKTKQLLFRGAQAYMENARVGSTAEENLTAQYPEPLSERLQACSRHKLNGQLLIGQDGKLRQPSASETALAVGVSKACSCCVRTVDVRETCARCDRNICQNCGKLCSCCNSITCSLCSVTESDDDVGDRIFCNDCLAFKD